VEDLVIDRSDVPENSVQFGPSHRVGGTAKLGMKMVQLALSRRKIL
jgi:hypothetical protein